MTGVHPLDQLSTEEIEIAASVLKAHAGAQNVLKYTFNVISLKEPSKSDILAYETNSEALPPQRTAFCIIHTQTEPSIIYEAVVDIEKREVTSWIKVVGSNPLATPDDCFEAEAVGKADVEVQRLLQERYGITDMSLVVFDPWSIHASPLQQRCIQLFTYMRSSLNDNAYSHPLDIVPIVDMDTKKVVRIDKYDQVQPWNKDDHNYHHQLCKAPWRTDLKPINVVQPEGPSFIVHGNHVEWQKWSFHVGFNYREGLVLNCLKYLEAGRKRPVAHRMSLVEMAVPYADPREPFVRKCAFDVGDYGLGYTANSLKLGCDCLGHIKYFDGIMANSKGEPYVLENAVCMHEDDIGLAWKHVDYRTTHNESRRGRRLVISFISTVVNYEYAFYWYLYQDGTIGHEIKLTGELSTNMLSPGEEEPEFGTLVGPGVNAQHHQHMFCARLDMCVDDEEGGKGLEVSEVDVEPIPTGPENPYGNAFKAQETTLHSVATAKRMIAPEKARIWKIKNPHVLNKVTKKPVAYKLVPAAHPPLLAQPGSIIYEKAHFATKNLWVTPFSEVQRYPAGEYVLQAKTCTGLAEWTAEDKALKDSDPVIWYAFGVTHVVRIEDFPVMPCESVGFMLKPVGFFTENPALDIPPNKNEASTQCH
ncbi:hypothetical protein CEUSTIGMA_g10899.t1 [Chlamydomonas eustigma]|uniref:Amine oxidase n=1 Tax=Chlamydomonas eustigma TaxID=1157962 RepID=A0A250XK74_9CHLO|nr:hypothetical protein CEUSTIGMA_g10899.t1 [Chlamydomonas eustigma]|eukprot:GAX83474.1 hypothetical protein CEUSTIGMA_g10899.t1 [Chlamydomonas eustigma]